MAVAETKVDETVDATLFSSKQLQAPISLALESGSNPNQPLSPLQRPNEFFPTDPFTQDNPLVNYDCSSAHMFSFNDNGKCPTPSPFDYH